ncbi:MAG: hypothetical protein J6D02_13630 [Lachnospira sp.]|nr:hypothetical protein [Lachnospira sp.]
MSERTIEDYIINELSPEDQGVALDFVKYLRNSEMEFVKDNGYWKDKIYYLIKYHAECVCFIAIKNPDEKENRWTVWSADIDSDWLGENQLEEELKEIAWSHVDTCKNCGSCGGGKPKMIFGKEFSEVCGCTFRIDNPGAEDLRFMKKMVEIRKSEICGKK